MEFAAINLEDEEEDNFIDRISGETEISEFWILSQVNMN